MEDEEIKKMVNEISNDEKVTKSMFLELMLNEEGSSPITRTKSNFGFFENLLIFFRRTRFG